MVQSQKGIFGDLIETFTRLMYWFRFDIMANWRFEQFVPPKSALSLHFFCLPLLFSFWGDLTFAVCLMLTCLSPLPQKACCDASIWAQCLYCIAWFSVPHQGMPSGTSQRSTSSRRVGAQQNVSEVLPVGMGLFFIAIATMDLLLFLLTAWVVFQVPAHPPPQQLLAHPSTCRRFFW